MINVGITGLRAVLTAGLTTPGSLVASSPLVLPTAGQRLKFGGILAVHITIEATAGTPFARYTTNGVTPTAAIGEPTASATPTAPIVLWFSGDDLLAKLLFIQASASLSWTYEFYQTDQRL